MYYKLILFVKNIISEPVFITFSILFIGLAIGKINIKGFSIGNTGIFFTGLIFGITGLKTSDFITVFGLAIFMYVIGIQGGVRFFNLIGKKGLPYLLIALTLSAGSLAGSILMAHIFHSPPEIILGIFTGNLTSASSLSILMEGGWKGKMIAAYGIVYPVGLALPVIFVQIIPFILRKNLYKETIREKTRELHNCLTSRKFMVENSDITGKKLSETGIREKTGATLSKLRRKGRVIIPGPETVLKRGDIVMAEGTEESLKLTNELLGNITYDNMEINPLIETRQIIITNPSVCETSLHELGISQNYHVVITKIWRSGIEFAPKKNFVLDIGDSILAVGKKKNLDRLVRLLGKQEKRTGEVDFLSMSFAIAAGIIAGNIHIPVPGVGIFMLGSSGGSLLVGMVLAYFRRLGFLTGQMSPAARNILKELGLSLFMAGIGEKAGMEIISMDLHSILFIILSSIFILLLSMISMLYVSYRYLRMNLSNSLSCIAGALTSSPALSVISSATNSEEPDLIFASMYPVSLICIVLTSQLLAIICTIT
ncbi:MAG: TrkA C-terminal domain-containing protein [Candidatus Eremiobacterota bacterium]